MNRHRIACLTVVASLVASAQAMPMTGAAALRCTRNGTAGSDRLVGTPGDDVLCGRGGNDVLIGRGGDDVLLGGTGNDRLVVGIARDVATGGDGRDTLSFADASRGLSADLSARRAIGSGSVAISGIEDIQGSPFGDSLRGNSLVNRLEGGGGADTLSGGGGEDVALGGAGNDILYGTPGGDVLRGGTGRDRCQMAPGVTRIDCERNTFGPDPILTTNTYRGMGDLPPLLENRTFSRGDWLHSRWMVKNDRIAHDEEPGTPFYTRAGDAAGNSGNIAVNTSASVPDTLAVDLWMEGPFHALGILRPSLHQTGFGAYRDGAGSFRFGATLDVIRGIGRIPGSVRFPILFPGPGTTTPIRLYGGTEFPDPLTACPRTFDAPSGPPIMAQLATNPRVRSFSVKTGGRALPACEFDETNYDGEAAGLARAILDGANAVVILPKDPLQRGKRYTVSFTSSGRTIRWSFSA